MQRLIRTGRTGHWLNHSKEHCLIGVRGNPNHNANLDCDVIVSEVRDKSRKPDEIYGLLERLYPNTRKLEFFGRNHNTWPGWITMGNQLDGTFVCDEALKKRWAKEYDDPAPPPKKDMVKWLEENVGPEWRKLNDMTDAYKEVAAEAALQADAN